MTIDSVICTGHLILYYSSDRIKYDEMGGTCSTHGTDEKFVKYFGWQT